MFRNHVFDVCPRFGYVMDVDYAVDIVEVANGSEYRREFWADALRTASVTVGPNADVSDVQYVLRFWHGVARGRAYSFKVKDYSDFEADGQPLLDLGSGNQQLLKRYIVDATYSDRTITKPRSPIELYDGVTLKTYGVDYTVDDVTGIVDLNFSPAGTLTWSGEFYVPVRFASSLPVEVMEARLQTVTFQLRETRLEEEEGT